MQGGHKNVVDVQQHTQYKRKLQIQEMLHVQDLDETES